LIFITSLKCISDQVDATSIIDEGMCRVFRNGGDIGTTEMTHMPREPEAFSEQVVHILRRFFPEKEVHLAGPMDLYLDGRHLGLNNLYRMVFSNPDRGVEIVEDFLEQLLDDDALADVQMPFSVAKDRIMPRIQPMAIFEQLDKEQVVYSPFVNETVILYVIDMPRMTVSITVEQMLRWGVSIDEIDRIARQNLSKYQPQLKLQIVEARDGGRAVIFNMQDGYDAARLLLTTLWKRLAPEFKGNFYVAAPARDMFMAISCGPDPFVEKLQERVNADYKRLPYPISGDLFLVTQDGVAGTRAA
tara:strand:- start:2823 stop:3728 length:906 start_codon:yes stop_codon:yes gene_type:complete